jgi:hypothetical protein
MDRQHQRKSKPIILSMLQKNKDKRQQQQKPLLAKQTSAKDVFKAWEFYKVI